MRLWLPLALTFLTFAPAAMAADETAVQISGPLGAIKGTLTLTASPPKAIAVLIQGSGPIDRDGNSGPALNAATARLLAQALAGGDIESIRYDKRGMFASSAAVADGNKVTIEDYADDARAFAVLAAKRAGLPCAWLIGHAEGSLVALQAAQQPGGLCGVVSISGPGRNLGEVLRSQIAANVAAAPPERKAQAEALSAQASVAITRLQVGRKVDTTNMDQNLLGLFDPAVQDFVINEFHYNPPALVAAYKGPVLILQGDADLQVSVEDADKLAGARAGVQRVLLPGVNHVLKSSPADRVINQATYADPNLPLAPAVADTIINFITAPRP
ncbi:MAG: alpha/beta hydrolase [Caulobacteraceae bacterium]|nr:alpha/beta hydrolase [Caulobacteraceae bacterium]